MGTYIVSGRIRSGTSMMMRCLEFGGLKVIKKELKIENEIDFPEDYHPNPNGFYEHRMIDYTNVDVGMATKILGSHIEKLPVVDGLIYNIVVMIRPRAEIIVSAKRAFNREYDILSVSEIKDYIESRPDFHAVYLNYCDVVDNPTRELMKLKDAGWKFNVAEAATVPTPNLYRNRIHGR